MKKLLLMLMVLFTTLTVNAKCDWSGYWMKKSYQSQNLFQFKTNLHYEDTCFNYTWLVYDYQLKRVDTLSEFAGGVVEVQFNAKGKYKVSIHAVNKCAKHGMASCDTNFVYNVDITIYGEKAKMGYKPSIKDCKSYTFEMNNMRDTCMSYYYEIWDGDEWIDSMTNREWDMLTDSAIYFGYGWEDKNLEYYSTKSERLLQHEFKDSGRYIVFTYWQNKCTGIDTWAFHKVTVCPTVNTSNVVNLVKPTPKVVAIYDMMGRRVYSIRKDELLIYIYDDGSRSKNIVTD
jgi:hypothetical protein